MNTYREKWIQKRKLPIAMALLFATIALDALAAPVHISVETKRGQEYGAGISVGKGPECFVVAPSHVIEFARSITVTDRRGRSAKADRYQSPDGIDAALLKVDINHTLDCPEDWSDGLTAESVMYDAEFLVSKKVKQSGMQQRRFFPGDITSSTIALRPYASGSSDRLVEGDSGSALYAKNKLLGMIVSVDTSTGEGLAIRQSQLHGVFGNIVLEQSKKMAVVFPVYYRNRENPYATAALRDFIDRETPFGLVELMPARIAENKKNARKGIAPVFPEIVDYVITSRIIDSQGGRESNPKYKSSSGKGNLKDKFLGDLKGENYRYFYKANIGIEVKILMPKENQNISHIQKINYKVPLKENVNERELKSQVPIKATVDATRAAFQKYGLPVIVRKEPPKKNILKQLFGGGR